jgi:hypothetical protein
MCIRRGIGSSRHLCDSSHQSVQACTAVHNIATLLIERYDSVGQQFGVCGTPKFTHGRRSAFEESRS